MTYIREDEVFSTSEKPVRVCTMEDAVPYTVAGSPHFLLIRSGDAIVELKDGAIHFSHIEDWSPCYAVVRARTVTIEAKP